MKPGFIDNWQRALMLAAVLAMGAVFWIGVYCLIFH